MSDETDPLRCEDCGDYLSALHECPHWQSAAVARMAKERDAAEKRCEVLAEALSELLSEWPLEWATQRPCVQKSPWTDFVTKLTKGHQALTKETP